MSKEIKKGDTKNNRKGSSKSRRNRSTISNSKMSKSSRVKSKTGRSVTTAKDKSGKSKARKDKTRRRDSKKSKVPSVILTVDPEIISKNQEQVDKIVALMDAVRADYITRDTKDDLDKVQTLIKNIIYREAGERRRIRPVYFTRHQSAVIKKVVRLSEDGAIEEEDIVSVNESGIIGSKLTYPFEKVVLVPTKASVLKKY